MIWMGHLSWLKNNLDGSFEPVEKQDLVGSLLSRLSNTIWMGHLSWSNNMNWRGHLSRLRM